MASLGFGRKRSHDELEDGDECLPISKRINSLHIEGRSTSSLQDGYTSVLIHSHEDRPPSTSSQSPGSADTPSMHQLQSRQPALLRLPQIDERSVAAHSQNSQLSREHVLNGLRPNLPCSPGVSQQTSSPMSSSPPQSSYLYQGSGQLASPLAYSTPSNAFLPNTLLPQNSPSSQQTVAAPHFFPLPTLQDSGHQHQLRHPQHEANPPHLQHPAFSSGLQLTNTETVMDAHQGFTQHGLQHQHQHHHQQLHQQQQQQQQLHTGQTAPAYSLPSDGPEESPPDFDQEQLPSGTYKPELGASENPFYFSANQMLYEAHVSRVRRLNQSDAML